MTDAVVVPEKTLEHWASQYISYRYRAQVALWWPSQGQDVEIRELPHAPGKLVDIELKTATPKLHGRAHDVEVDLGQLWDYRHRPPSRRPFYVFPEPFWLGNLAAAMGRHSLPVTEAAFSRADSWWCARWLVAMTTDDVARTVSPQLQAHASSSRGTKARLVRFNPGNAPIWGVGSRSPATVMWRSLWTELEGCGRPDWPQVVRVPSRAMRGKSISWSDLSAVWRELSSWEEDDDLVTLESQGDDGIFIYAEPTSDDASRPVAEAADAESDEHRVSVFLTRL